MGPMDAPILIEFELQYPDGPRVRASAVLGRAPITVLFGPSGSGKTTILRCLAGLERPQTGQIGIDGEMWLDTGKGLFVSPQRRRVGYVPQDQALFPHLTVAGNVGFGLSRLNAGERHARIRELVDLLGLKGLEARRPSELSGGQRQRVAIARALAPHPRVLLLDEPLSSLDAPTRERLRRELRGLILRSGVPAIVVTHDRAEALELGDEIAVVIDGAIRQVGPVSAVFGRPSDAAVASAVGVETVVPGSVMGGRESLSDVRAGDATLVAFNPAGFSGEVLVCIRAEDVVLSPGAPGQESARNRLAGVVESVEPDGSLIRVRVACGFSLAALVTKPAAAELELAPGRAVTALVKAPDVHLIPRE